MMYILFQRRRSQCQSRLETKLFTCSLTEDVHTQGLAPKTFYDQYYSNVPLKPTSVLLSTYTGETLYPLGEANIKLEYAGQEYSLPLIVVPKGSNALFGRNWLQDVKLDWPNLPGLKQINQVSSVCKTLSSAVSSGLQSVIQKHSCLFESNLGCYNGPPVDLKVSKEPKFYKARSVPYGLKSKVETALLNVERDGVIDRVASGPCATPIVIVGKKNSEEVRSCEDFSLTYNSCADVETHPLPKLDDLHEALRGCKVFSILDMSQAYHQIPLAKESQSYLTINTHVGLFSLKRLPNGVHSGPAIFQRIMDSTLAGIPKVVCYLDDILVAGVDKDDHLNSLSQVFEKLFAVGFQIKKAKCEFEKTSIQYLGQVLGSRNYMVNIQGQLWKRHIDQLIRSRLNEQPWCLTSFPVNYPAGIESESVSGSPVTSALPGTDMSLQSSRSHNLPQFVSNAPQEQQEFVTEQQVPELQEGTQASGIPGMSPPTQPERRYPTRVRTAPSYLKHYER